MLASHNSMRIFTLALILLVLSACVPKNNNHNGLSEVAADYFRVYSQRKDIERLMSFYDNEAQFEDIIYGNRLKNKKEIKHFLAWGQGEFKVLSGELALTVTKQTVKKTSVVTQGFFHEFSYDSQKLGPWLFVIVQEFNAQNKIIKQTDWINYTPRKSFLGGKNMNNELIPPLVK